MLRRGLVNCVTHRAQFLKKSTLIQESLLMNRLQISVGGLQMGFKNVAKGPIKKSLQIQKIRNIGIIAHIDAGKTTTTERMLFYAGEIGHPGEVHQGNTVMDYMEQERKRGITIRAASTSFLWDGHQINLIDTPGHVDFTGEVERALRVTDGAVCIIDSLQGVETQSQTVWNQADKNRIPRLTFLNKLDKEGSTLEDAVDSLKEQLQARVLLLNVPLAQGKQFSSVVDLLTLEIIEWTDNLGTLVKRYPLQETHPLYTEMQAHRQRLLDQLSNYDDQLAELFLEGKEISLDVINHTISKALKEEKVTAVLCGSALKNRGIQPLLDAIIKYLPCPSGGQQIIKKNKDKETTTIQNVDLSGPLTALAFKVVADKQKGLITFLRLYGGKLKTRETVKAVGAQHSPYEEKVGQLFKVKADEMALVDEVGPGDITAVVGFKHVISGDTIIGEESDERYLPGLDMPPAVFFCGIEASHSRDSKELTKILKDLTREDPSLRYLQDQETGQGIIAGMGELHIEILRDRIALQHGIEPVLGRMRVSYRESFTDKAEHHQITYKEYQGKKLFAEVKIRLQSMEEDDGLDQVTGSGGQNEIVFDFQNLKPFSEKSQIDAKEARKYGKKGKLDVYEFKRSLESLPDEIKSGIHDTISDFLTCGPALGYPLVRVRVRVLDGRWSSLRSNEVIFKQCVVECMKKAVQETGSKILEPFVTTEITCFEDSVGFIVSDINTARRGNILQINNVKARNRNDKRVIRAIVPLSEMVGYSSQLRSLTRGQGHFSMAFSHYKYVGPQKQSQILSFGGLY